MQSYSEKEFENLKASSRQNLIHTALVELAKRQDAMTESLVVLVQTLKDTSQAVPPPAALAEPQQPAQTSNWTQMSEMMSGVMKLMKEGFTMQQTAFQQARDSLADFEAPGPIENDINEDVDPGDMAMVELLKTAINNRQQPAAPPQATDNTPEAQQQTLPGPQHPQGASGSQSLPNDTSKGVTGSLLPPVTPHSPNIDEIIQKLPEKVKAAIKSGDMKKEYCLNIGKARGWPKETVEKVYDKIRLQGQGGKQNE